MTAVTIVTDMMFVIVLVVATPDQITNIEVKFIVLFFPVYREIDSVPTVQLGPLAGRVALLLAMAVGILDEDVSVVGVLDERALTVVLDVSVLGLLETAVGVGVASSVAGALSAPALVVPRGFLCLFHVAVAVGILLVKVFPSGMLDQGAFAVVIIMVIFSPSIVEGCA